MIVMESPDHSPTASPDSLGRKITVFFSCCSPAADEEERPLSFMMGTTSPPSSICARSKVHELPNLSQKCRNLVAGIKRRHQRHHHCAGPFGYDPVSYAQNFDEGRDDELEDSGAAGGFLHHNFSSHLPAIPPVPPGVGVACRN